jgi:hypothetical protein
METTMKTFLNILALFTALTLVAGVTTAMADQQRSDEAAIYSQQAHGSGPYASAHGEILSMTDFQAQGSH